MEFHFSGRRLQGWLPHILVILLAWPPGIGAQTPAGQAAPNPSLPTVQSLKVIPLAGNRELNDMQRKVMAPLVVQVLDQNDQPVVGAAVVFRFPLEGPSATFPGQRNAYTFRTNADGQAAATGWMANGRTGTFHVQVTASRGNEQGSVSIAMTNVNRIVNAGKRHGKSWWSSPWAKVIVIGGAAGAVAAIVLLTHHSNSSGPTITATPGAPGIGGPQ